MTAQWALERYPFFSADSSAALVGAGMGRVCTFNDGRMVSTSWQAHADRKLLNMEIQRARKRLAALEGMGPEDFVPVQRGVSHEETSLTAGA